MRKDVFPFVLIIALLLSGFFISEPETPSAYAAVTPVPAAVSVVEGPESAADGEELIRCLRNIGSWPESAAGSSLRLALLTAELADWAEANPGGWRSAEAKALSYLRGLSDSEREALLRHLTQLRELAASKKFLELLADAGRENAPPLQTNGPLFDLLDGIADAAASMSIQNPPEKMNIHCGCRCRQEKSLL